MADSALNFKMLFWVDDISKKCPAHQEAISRIYRRLYEEKIGIPFPQRTVWMRDEGQSKPSSPHDEKFKSVHNKYFLNSATNTPRTMPDKRSSGENSRRLSRIFAKQRK